MECAMALRRSAPPLAAMLLAAAGLAGCEAKLAVRQYPAFYDPELKTVAVLPFANRTLRQEAGAYVAQRLGAALAANGTYEAIGPDELQSRLNAAGLSLPRQADPAAAADVLRRLGGIQAFITGTVTAFSADRSAYVDVDRGYVFGGYGYGYGHHPWWGRSPIPLHRDWSLGAGWEYPWVEYHHYVQASAAATAVLVRTADGKTIHAPSAPASVRFVSYGRPPETTDEALMRAADYVAQELLEHFAVVPRQLTIDPGKALRTARPTADGRTRFTDDFRPDDEKMYVVVELPPAAVRNPFRLVVARKDGEEALAEAAFDWPAATASRRFVFSPAKLAAQAGQGKYHVKLYADAAFVAKRAFEIER